VGAASTIVGCSKEQSPAVAAAEKAAKEKAAADKAASDVAAASKAAADKAAMDKAIADKNAAEAAAATKAAADKAAMDKMAAEKATLEKAAADKAAAEKAAAAKAAADKAAAEKAASDAKATAAALPPDLLEMKAEITRAASQIDLTMAKLDSLSTATGDLDKPSEDTLAAIETLEKELNGLKKRGDEMRDKGSAYFEKWEKQLATMSTPDVAEIATKRKEELAAKYSAVLTAMQESRAAMDSYWADMSKIQKAIDDDLTPETQKLLVGQVKAAKEKAATLKERVNAGAEKLNDVGLIYKKP
jgi:hypothetical protein